MEKLFNEKLLNEISQQLLSTGQTIAIAESVTSGLLQNAFSNCENASDFFEGGITAYTIDQKVNLLHINKEEAEAVDCVSQKIANDMARNIATLFGTKWGVGITGYATAVPESGNELYAYYSIWYNNHIKDMGKIIPAPKDPNIVQQEYAVHVLEKMHSAIHL